MNRYPKPKYGYSWAGARQKWNQPNPPSLPPTPVNISISDSFHWTDTPLTSYFVGLFLNQFPVNSWNIGTLPVEWNIGLLGDGFNWSDSVTTYPPPIIQSINITDTLTLSDAVTKQVPRVLRPTVNPDKFNWTDAVTKKLT